MNILEKGVPLHAEIWSGFSTHKFKEMNKGLIAFSLVPFAILAAFIIEVNSSKDIDLCMYIVDYEINYDVSEEQLVSKNEQLLDLEDCFISPNLNKSFVGFKEALAFKESRGNYLSVNTYGYLGKYQFGKSTLKMIGVYDTSDFLNDPKLQEKAFIANAMRNKWILRRDINRFVGKRIGGVLVTESGILAAAHLAGPGSVKKYLRSYGAIGFADAYGTTIRSYMKKFSGYDTSNIIPNRKAKVSII